MLSPNSKILKNPTRVFNLDEISFYLYPKSYLVLAEKESHVYDTSPKSDKESTIYKYKRMNQEIVISVPQY